MGCRNQLIQIGIPDSLPHSGIAYLSCLAIDFSCLLRLIQKQMGNRNESTEYSEKFCDASQRYLTLARAPAFGGIRNK